MRNVVMILIAVMLHNALALVVVLSMVPPVMGQPRYTPQGSTEQQRWESEVLRCRLRMAQLDRRFSANVPAPGHVDTIGNDRARYEFVRCMAEYGFPIVSR